MAEHLHVTGAMLPIFARAAKARAQSAEFSPRDCIEDCLRLLAVRTRQKDLELSLDLGAEIPDALIADSGRLPSTNEPGGQLPQVH